ncbi:hypothetical protein [Pseudomonas rhizoryzae]|uniref:hypothetical protein n=1 Tax=Pseudomonas rhizoryzae TaxID=2571129 RepID=UPI0010C1FFD6|nr:hypothetical protein [Pseudomonas rhizoryzae]
MSEKTEPGYCEGDICGRDGCQGLIKDHPVDGCTCFICAPCSACTAERGYCPHCGWEAADDPLIRRDMGPISLGAGFAFVEPVRRVLDPSKVDFVIKLHTASSMIKEGVYPPHMSRQEVEEKVRGTFGGRFNKFKDGFFEYVAYTD